MFKSTDDGQTWESTRVWENPYEGREFDEEPAWGMDDTLYMPMNGSIVVDNNGVVHVALNTFEMAHTLENEPGYYSYYYGRAVDGILYWNDTQVAPIQSEDGNPHHAARLWWPAEEEGYVTMHTDPYKWIGYIPMYEGYDWENDYLYSEEYHSKFYGASGHPALSCDPFGNLAVAFSTPDVLRLEDMGLGFYPRSIYVNYRNVDEGYWRDIEDWDYITSTDLNIMHMTTEAVFTISVLNTTHPGEFWFGYQDDDQIGFYWGSNASQSVASDNIIQAVKILPEFVNVPETEAKEAVYSIYPNPVTDNVMNVQSAMDVNATITIVNLVGQTVKQFNKNLYTGNNAINVDLTTGVYFCTISANGFNKTVKFVVK
jgi:hypothetical protein